MRLCACGKHLGRAARPQLGQSDMSIENEKGTLSAILEKIQTEAARKADYIAPTDALQVQTVDGNTNIILEANRGMPTMEFQTNEVAFQQLASNCDIDVRTARRLRDNENYSAEFDNLINKILVNEPKSKMLRTFDGDQPLVRAIVSDKFKTFDNVDLVESALPQLMDSPANWQIVNGTVTDHRLYLRLKSLVQVAEPALGDHMANGILLRNSEVGMGSVEVRQMVFTLACLNGMMSSNITRHTHVTSARGTDDWSVLTAEAKNADNHALQLKLRDVVASYASRESFDQTVEQMRIAHGDIVENGLANPAAVVDSVVKVLSLPKKSSDSIMAGLMQTIQQPGYSNKPISRATIVNAVTAVAHTADADSVDDWYSNGRAVLDLPRNQWETIARAA
tara:strand:+ start:1569 stop:2750 length:1182 start_codon:yes stop_codon:yes gene_type:complete